VTVRPASNSQKKTHDFGWLLAGQGFGLGFGFGFRSGFGLGLGLCFELDFGFGSGLGPMIVETGAQLNTTTYPPTPGAMVS